MKKLLIAIFFVFSLFAKAQAQDATLYDTYDTMLSAVEMITSCAAGEIVCTEDDAKAVKISAKHSFRNLAGIMQSGEFDRMYLTVEQIHKLDARARALQERLVKIEMFDVACNAEIYFLSLFMQTFLWLIQMPLAMIYVLIKALFTGDLFLFLSGIVIYPLWYLSNLVLAFFSFFVVVFLAPTCLFWWL